MYEYYVLLLTLIVDEIAISIYAIKA